MTAAAPLGRPWWLFDRPGWRRSAVPDWSGRPVSRRRQPSSRPCRCPLRCARCFPRADCAGAAPSRCCPARPRCCSPCSPRRRRRVPGAVVGLPRLGAGRRRRGGAGVWSGWPWCRRPVRTGPAWWPRWWRASMWLCWPLRAGSRPNSAAGSPPGPANEEAVLVSVGRWPGPTWCSRRPTSPGTGWARGGTVARPGDARDRTRAGRGHLDPAGAVAVRGPDGGATKRPVEVTDQTAGRITDQTITPGRQRPR